MSISQVVATKDDQGATSNTIDLLLIEEQTVLREGLRLLFGNSARCRVVGEAGDRAKALDLAALQTASLLLVDPCFDGRPDFDFLCELGAKTLAPILVLTASRDPQEQLKAITNGARGLVFKDQSFEIVLKAVERVQAGEVWFDHSILANAIADFALNRKDAPEEDPAAERIKALTRRERSVIVAVARGMRNKQIAEQLYICEATVRNHLASVYRKLDISTRLELALYAQKHGLEGPPQA